MFYKVIKKAYTSSIDLIKIYVENILLCRPWDCSRKGILHRRGNLSIIAFTSILNLVNFFCICRPCQRMWMKKTTTTQFSQRMNCNLNYGFTIQELSFCRPLKYCLAEIELSAGYFPRTTYAAVGINWISLRKMQNVPKQQYLVSPNYTQQSKLP